MREIDSEELKKIQLNILEKLHKLCEEEGWQYSLAYGTLLGAIRHKGFIPWDDDIDIFMPRRDFEKLIAFCKTNETPFRLICSESDKKYGYLFAKAVDRNTVIIEEIGDAEEIEMGVYIDIFPIDGLGDSYKNAKKSFMAGEFQRELLVASNWKKFFRSKTHAIYYEPIRFAFFVLSRFVNKRKLIYAIEKKYKKIELDEAKYAGVMCGAYRSREVLKKEIYVNYTDVVFEGIKFRGLEKYDEYLSAIYGDYMKMPPEDKRVTHHMFRAYYK